MFPSAGLLTAPGSALRAVFQHDVHLVQAITRGIRQRPVLGGARFVTLFNQRFDLRHFAVVNLCAPLQELLRLLLQQEPEQFLQGGAQVDDGEVAEIEALIKQRNEARAAKDWALADAARDRLNEMNIVLEDGPQGTTWRRK